MVLEVGDKLRLNVKLIQILNRKWEGTSLLVEVKAITEQADGTKLLTVQEPR